MAQFQFFYKPDTLRKEITYLDPANEDFAQLKEQLLNRGYVASPYQIHAETESDALVKFRLVHKEYQ
ncbi:TPA: hypothetical protein ACX6QU_001813 [Photobacterium damselae]|uniref:Uncharacterized protein n=2 Tax=Photobacterium damselae TaxID=38293 RepID=A0A2T3QLX9_PHODM|nr:hypothetical protein [Photobacterium damselae]ARR49221.1 hypothetical protein CAY62_06310 [Photobacterium damselae subsp. damselae]AWK81958.1 hypothetical protein BST98_07745 [Photobacterium damselae]EHA1079369.1 hypothetical protein [Photobacterium damselae]MBA5682188.1 hypothetical protein [Photobacterium damselae subsp. damselae]MCG3816414.1 hypothetical protein [Photobacterium damselae]